MVVANTVADVSRLGAVGDAGIVDSYFRDGYAVLEDFLTPGECDALIALSETLSNARNGTMAPVMMPHREVPKFTDTMSTPRLVALMEQMLSGRVDGLQTQFFFGRPGIHGFSTHQDNYFVEAPSDAFGSAWLAVDDVDVENGALFVYPGSHREGILPVRVIADQSTPGQDPNANRQECILPPGYSAVDVPVRRGTVIFLHGYTVHGSHNNATANRLRRALLMTFIRQGMPFRAGNVAARNNFSVYRNEKS